MAKEWIELGRLADLTSEKVRHLRNAVGFYRFIDENGKDVYLGKAVEFSNGGIAKRLMDYIRSSDSARKHGSGQAIHSRRETLNVKYLKIGIDQDAGKLTNAREKDYIEKFRPELNVQHNRGKSSPALEEKSLSSGRGQSNFTPDADGGLSRQIIGEVVETGVYDAVAEALLGGAISAVRNGLAYRDGSVDGRQALANVGKDAARSVVHGRSTRVLGVGVRHGAKQLGIPMKSNIATAMASALVETGVTVRAFAKGEITAEEAGERIGQTGCSAAGGIYVGAAAGSIFGPPGAVVGSMVGYMATAWIYQSCMAVLKQANLAEEEAARLEALCSEAVREWNLRRQEFDSRMAGLLEERHTAFSRCFVAIDEALESNETDNVVRGLAQLATMTGSALKFEGFEEFKELMKQETDARLVI